MKNSTMSVLLCAVLFLCCSLSYGQASSGDGRSVRINLYGSYAFEDSFDSYYDYGNYYQGKLKDGFQYGGGVEVEIQDRAYVELLYLREDTHAPTQYFNGGLYDKYADFNIGINYIMLGGTKSFGNPGSVIEGFGGFMAGVGVLGIDNPNNGNSDSVTKFAWGLKAGAIVWPMSHVGIKLQAQMLSVVQSVGGGVYYGTGGGGAAVSTYSSLYQFTIGGGLVFEVGK